MTHHGQAVQLLTLNVNGMGGPAKTAAIMQFLVRLCRKPDIVCLQELKMHDASVLEARLASGRGSGLPFKCVHFASLGSSHARGVAVLISHRLLGMASPEVSHAADVHGRLVRVDLTLLGRSLSVLSVYAPNSGQAQFFEQELQPFLPHDRLCLVGGDFNCFVDQLDQSSSGTHRLCGAATLRGLMAAAGLVDAYRHLAPAGREYTHLGTHGLSAARLDRWLVPGACLSWVGSLEHVHGAPSDHAGALLTLQLPDMPSFGPGLSCFPLHVLYDGPLLAKLRRGLQDFLAAHPVDPAPGQAWERWVQAKEWLLTAGLALSRAQRREQLQRLRRLSKEVQRAHRRLRDASSGAMAAMRTAADTLRAEVCAQAKQVAFSAAAMWRDHGERTTAWHFAQAGQVHSHTPPRSFSSADGSSQLDMRMVKSGLDLHDIVWQHFAGDAPQGLFAVRPTDAAAQQRLLAGVSSLSPAQVAPASGPAGDGSITEACLAAALSSCRLGASPGRDGLQYEVYKVLWDELSGPLVAALAYIFAAPSPLPQAWGEGVILPIFKGKGLPADRLASYRPITLLNADLKLAQRVLSDRLQAPLDLWVSPAQSAFLRGRSIADNVLLTQGLMEYLAAERTPGAMLVLDIKQAYDRVDRRWLTACAQRMGLPQGCMRWLELFTTNTCSRVMLNGHVSPAFAVLNGLPQGGPLAPLLWVLQLQPFTAALERAQSSGLFRSPLLPSGGQAPPVSHHADDTKLYLRELAVDGAPALACVGDYTQASGAIMHPDKNTGVCMGSHAPVVGVCPVTHAAFGEPGSPPVVSLGVPCCVDMQAAAAVVYPRRMASIHSLSRKWRPFQLSFVGRTLNAKQLMANSVTYHAQFVPLPAAELRALGDAITSYIVTSPFSEDATISSHGRLQPLPKRGIACLSYGMGGLAVPDLPSQVASLQAKVLAEAFSPGPHPWKALMQHALLSASPEPGLGPAWALLPAVPIPAALSPRMTAYVGALRSCQPSLVPSSFDAAPIRALLLLPLPCLHPLFPGLPAWPLQSPAGWPLLLGQLATCPLEVRASPVLAALEAALPDRLREAVEVAAGGEPAVCQHDTCWLSADGSLVALSAAPGGPLSVFALSAAGVLAAPPPAAAFDAASAVPACVLEVPKPKYQWSLEEQAAYSAAHPKDRPSKRPLHRRLLGPWRDVTVYPCLLYTSDAADE